MNNHIVRKVGNYLPALLSGAQQDCAMLRRPE